MPLLTQTSFLLIYIPYGLAFTFSVCLPKLMTGTTLQDAFPPHISSKSTHFVAIIFISRPNPRVKFQFKDIPALRMLKDPKNTSLRAKGIQGITSLAGMTTTMLIGGELLKRITGVKKNPYHPKNVLSYTPSSPAYEMTTESFEAVSRFLLGDGDIREVARTANTVARLVPYYWMTEHLLGTLPNGTVTNRDFKGLVKLHDHISSVISSETGITDKRKQREYMKLNSIEWFQETFLGTISPSQAEDMIKAIESGDIKTFEKYLRQYAHHDTTTPRTFEYREVFNKRFK